MSERTMLEQWTRVRDAQGHVYLLGTVFGHPRLRDGATAMTTEIQEAGTTDDGTPWARSLNTLYHLGTRRGGLAYRHHAVNVALFLRLHPERLEVEQPDGTWSTLADLLPNLPQPTVN